VNNFAAPVMKSSEKDLRSRHSRHGRIALGGSLLNAHTIKERSGSNRICVGEGCRAGLSQQVALHRRERRLHSNIRASLKKVCSM
jgi:hypothetical protein